MTKDPVATMLRQQSASWLNLAAAAEESGDLASAKWRLEEAVRLDRLDRLERLERQALAHANKTWHAWCQCLR